MGTKLYQALLGGLSHLMYDLGSGNIVPATTLVDSAGNDLGGGNSGITASADFTAIAAAYGGGDIQGGSGEFAFTDRNGVAVPAGSLIRVLTSIVKIDLNAVPSGQTSFTLQSYSVTQPSAQADNDAWTMVSGDLASYKGGLPLGTPVGIGGCLYVKTTFIDPITGAPGFDIKLASSSLFGRLVTDGGHTVASSPPVRTISLYGIVL